MSLGKAVVKMCVMDEEMATYATAEADNALSCMFHEKEVAQYMKRKFEAKYKPNWHCIVGRDFGAYVTHETGRYIYFYIGQKGFLIWSTPS